MPELPEVETVKETLKEIVLHKKIKQVEVLYPNIVAHPTIEEFIHNVQEEIICDIHRRGKWLVFELSNHYLLSHLRMEGKYLIRKQGDVVEKHEHIIFTFNDTTQLRYKDTRKFGRMHLIKKDEFTTYEALLKIGMEPFDNKLTFQYLLDKYKRKNIPIKTALLDQSIIAGIGNIYADEILFLCHLNPLKKCCLITKQEAKKIITYTKEVLQNAISKGGTTIRSYESQEGVHGRFQQQLLVHTKEGDLCPQCRHSIHKIVVGGRGTYYCPYCQK